MPSKLNIANALLLCALALTGCGPKPPPRVEEPVLPVRPVTCNCPKPATPPEELMQRPIVEAFLPQT